MSNDKSDLIAANGLAVASTTSAGDGSIPAAAGDVSNFWLPYIFLLANAGIDPNIALFFLLLQQSAAPSGVSSVLADGSANSDAPLASPTSATLSADPVDPISIPAIPPSTPLDGGTSAAVPADLHPVDPISTSNDGSTSAMLPTDLYPIDPISIPASPPSTPLDGGTSAAVPADLYPVDPISTSNDGSTSATLPTDLYPIDPISIPASPPSTPLDGGTSAAVPADLYPVDPISSTGSNAPISALVPVDLYPVDPVLNAEHISTLGDASSDAAISLSSIMGATPFIYQDAQPAYASSALPGDARFLAESPAATAVFNTWTSLLDPHIAAAEAILAPSSAARADAILAAPVG